MKQIKLLAVLILLLTYSSTLQAGGGLKWHSFEEGVAKAKKENKFLLVDFYTNWCSWCKKMDADTYKNVKVLEYLNKHFVAVKLNPEDGGKVEYKGTSYPSAQFTQMVGVKGYPATGFFDSKSEFIGLVPGYLNSTKFIDLLEYVVKGDYTKKG